MRLNLGSGTHPFPEWTNVDIQDLPGVDVQADLRALPFEDDCAELVYLGHTLEHFVPEDVAVVMAEVKRVLQWRGTVVVVGPDLDRAYKLAPQLVPVIWPGGTPDPGPRSHKWPATEAETVRLLEAAGWTALPFPVGELEVFWPCVDRSSWQFALEARPS